MFLASAKVTSKVASLLTERNLSKRLVYQANFQTRVEKLSNPRYSPLGQEMVVIQDENLAKENCGQEYIDQIVHGGKIYILVDFDFYDKEIQNRIETKIEFKVLGFKKTKTFTKLTREEKQNTRINIDAFQVGGDPSQLDAILQDAQSTNCSLDEIDKCHDIIDRLFDYATADGRFREQLDHSPLTYITAPYEERGFRDLIKSPNPILTGANKFAHEALLSKLVRQQGFQDRLEELIVRKDVPPDQLRDLRNVQEDVIQNVLVLKEAVKSCEINPNICLTVESNTNSQLILIQDSSVNVERNLYQDCINRVALGYEGAFSKIFAGTSHSSCLDLYRNAESVYSLSLKDLKLDDVNFLRYLPKIRSLDISDNQISNIYPLRYLSRLEELDMSRNGVSQVFALGELDRLKTLDLHHNNVTSLSAIYSLPLQYIKAYANLLNLDEVQSRFPTATKVFTYDEAVVEEADRLISLGKIARLQFERYWELRFAPVYYEDSNQVEWLPMLPAVELYD
ncbi:hypothetical protein SAMN06296036_12662 [Pseudobacteriovorax antillogorgiicola]|uniref:Leucine Rich repeat-containing protein n=1 Tax=Pseudobacteriovorax antillogorgiicola TaxID=1513793 RepID=A0A1Y6CJY6_9BACT|nr:hypothetical protein EDD56_12636 [Pseudobacteriovorax antillogorgiicola]SMF71278.1 hypothetical protein SAMN06296036_12662 [Pseudobacteriovorax antillogorgiicola]